MFHFHLHVKKCSYILSLSGLVMDVSYDDNFHYIYKKDFELETLKSPTGCFHILEK